ncbi:MAG: STAS domain-containing protein [Acidimicrobiales bacterium]
MADSYTLSLGGLQVHWEVPNAGVAHVALEGDLDTLSVPVLRQAIHSLYDAGHFGLTFDLTNLHFIDSSGIGALVEAWRKGQESGGRVTATNPTTAVRRLMDVTGISRYLLPAADDAS